jgi:hypothetical protein
MVEGLVLAAVGLMAVVLGYSLGLAQALEQQEQAQLSQLKYQSQKDLELALEKSKVEGLEREWKKEKAQVLALQSELDLAQVKVQDLELVLGRAQAQAQRAELALEEHRYRNQETDWKGHH